MELDEIIKTLAEADQRSKSNGHRLDKLEKQTEAIHRMAVSMERMAAKQDTMNENMTTLTGKVEALEAEPGKKWKAVTEKVLGAVAAAAAGFLLAQVGL